MSNNLKRGDKLKRFKAKKAALDVSINSIVVIIFAIVMLGLGIAFIRGMFGGITGQIEDIIPGIKLEKAPTVDDPFTISTTQLKVNRGETKILEVGYYNFENAQKDITLEVSCLAATGIAIKNPGTSARSVAASDSIGWRVSITAQKTTNPDTYSCTSIAKASGVAKKYQDFFIIVP